MIVDLKRFIKYFSFLFEMYRSIKEWCFWRSESYGILISLIKNIWWEKFQIGI